MEFIESVYFHGIHWIVEISSDIDLPLIIDFKAFSQWITNQLTNLNYELQHHADATVAEVEQHKDTHRVSSS